MREIERADLTAYLTYTIEVPGTAEQSFEYVTTRLGAIYTNMARGHEYFRVRGGGPLRMGSVIDCAEHAGNQRIVHEYKVREFVPGQRVQYSSCPSDLRIRLPWKTIESTSDSHVWYDFADVTRQRSAIRITIGIQFHSSPQMLVSRMTGGLMPWRAHCREEMLGLQRAITTDAVRARGEEPRECSNVSDERGRGRRATA
ncbi:MAG: hypothetical protein JXA87_04655 [Thermoleophilia bacterium]|nr:hypothetical protein [Thermoleophilia bacterium]